MILSLRLAPKYRRQGLDTETLVSLKAAIGKACADFETDLVHFKGEENQLYLLVNVPPKVPIPVFINRLMASAGVPLSLAYLQSA